MTRTVSDFRVDHLSDEERAIAEVVLKTVRDRVGANASGGGCRAFYSPAEWAARGEEYGKRSELIIAHDGGDIAAFCDWDRCDYAAMELLRKALEDAGYWVEQCTTWYSAVYK